VLLDVFRVYEYIQAKEVGQGSHEGPTRVGARLPPLGAPSCLVAACYLLSIALDFPEEERMMQ